MQHAQIEQHQEIQAVVMQHIELYKILLIVIYVEYSVIRVAQMQHVDVRQEHVVVQHVDVHHIHHIIILHANGVVRGKTELNVVVVRRDSMEEHAIVDAQPIHIQHVIHVQDVVVHHVKHIINVNTRIVELNHVIHVGIKGNNKFPF